MGRLGTGKIYNGRLSQGDDVLLLKRDGSRLPYRVAKIFSYEGLKKVEVKEASAGDIISIAGLEAIDIGETVADRENPEVFPQSISTSRLWP
jgi:GTP-binding protein